MADAVPATPSQSREAELLLACARITPGPEQNRSIAMALAAGVDWSVLLPLAEAHGLLALLFRSLQSEGLPPLPPAVEMRLWTYQEQLRRKNQFMVAELVAILERFAGEGIGAIPYKGPTLAVEVYGDLGLREFGDLDLLLRPAQIPRARDLLAALGYAPLFKLTPSLQRALLDSPGQYHLALKKQIMVELHWNTDAEFPVADLSDEAWWATRPTVAIAGREVPRLDDCEMILALLLHGSKHLWEQLNWLAELAELLRRRPGLDWDRLVETTVRLRARKRVAVGLLLLERWFDTILPNGVETRLGTQEAGSVANLISRQWLLVQQPKSWRAFERLTFNLNLYDSVGQGIRHATRVLKPGFEEWSRWPLPRPLHALYLPIRAARLAGKYFALASRR